MGQHTRASWTVVPQSDHAWPQRSSGISLCCMKFACVDAAIMSLARGLQVRTRRILGDLKDRIMYQYRPSEMPADYDGPRTVSPAGCRLTHVKC